ncbi:MAG: FAD binding domain-containing protein [Jatrophihabitantaceae bacterium]
MITAPFDYYRAGSVAEAVALLGEHGEDAKLLAGGHSLLPMMKLRLAFPSVLIDVGRLTEASYLRLDGEVVAIGALTRHCELVASELLRAEAPLLARVASLVGDPQIRHRGTIGGSLAHADPAADLPAAVLASDAVLVAEGPAGRREIAATEFFLGYYQTALRPTEVLTEIRIPRTGGQGWHYEKFVRRANDWAIVAVATVAGRISLANMGSRPIRAAAAERALAAGASPAEAAELAAADTEPIEDLNADADYRRQLARVLTRRALVAASR